nr:hypothetical protein [Brucella pseudogrignonensis]
MIKHHTTNALFKPVLSRIKAQKAATDKTAKAIMVQEKSVLDAKTQRLRAARIAQSQNLRAGFLPYAASRLQSGDRSPASCQKEAAA